MKMCTDWDRKGGEVQRLQVSFTKQQELHVWRFNRRLSDPVLFSFNPSPEKSNNKQ